LFLSLFCCSPHVTWLFLHTRGGLGSGSCGGMPAESELAKPAAHWLVEMMGSSNNSSHLLHKGKECLVHPTTADPYNHSPINSANNYTGAF